MVCNKDEDNMKSWNLLDFGRHFRRLSYHVNAILCGLTVQSSWNYPTMAKYVSKHGAERGQIKEKKCERRNLVHTDSKMSSAEIPFIFTSVNYFNQFELSANQIEERKCQKQHLMKLITGLATLWNSSKNTRYFFTKIFQNLSKML